MLLTSAALNIEHTEAQSGNITCFLTDINSVRKLSMSIKSKDVAV